MYTGTLSSSTSSVHSAMFLEKGIVSIHSQNRADCGEGKLENFRLGESIMFLLLLGRSGNIRNF